LAEDNEALVKLITGRQSKLETDKSNFMERMQEAADYVAPHREDVRGTYQKGLTKGTKIYDGTPVGAAVLAADGIHGYHVSPAFPWFKYEINRKEANKIPEIRQWLEDTQWYMTQALNRSNFYSEVWSFIYDGLTLGTPDIYPEEDLIEERISFEAIHPGEIYIAENRYGEIDLLHRKKKFTVRQLVKMFGKDTLSESMRAMHESNPFTEYEVLHAVFPRDEYDSRIKDAKNKRYASVWIITGDSNKVARVSGFDKFPHHVWRYMRSGKEPYAITPAMLAMADIKGVNLIAKTDLGARQMALDPPLNVPSYMEGKVQWKPRGLNYYEEGKQIKGIFPANTGSNFVPIEGVLDRKDRAIKERFHVDTFLMLSSLNAQGGQRTAYEVSELMAEKAAVLGAELGPLNTQLDAILDDTYEIEKRAGRMPPPPDILLELASQDPALRFDPVYMGPLAQAQRERFAKDGIRKFIMEIVPLIQVKEDILDNFDLDDLSRTLAETDGVPQSIIVDIEKRDAIRQGRMEAMEQQSQMEALAQGTDALQKVAKADKDTGGGIQKGLAGLMGGANAA